MVNCAPLPEDRDRHRSPHPAGRFGAGHSAPLRDALERSRRVWGAPVSSFTTALAGIGSGRIAGWIGAGITSRRFKSAILAATRSGWCSPLVVGSPKASWRPAYRGRWPGVVWGALNACHNESTAIRRKCWLLSRMAASSWRGLADTYTPVASLRPRRPGPF